MSQQQASLMDTRTLEQFTALADTLHFGRASERCHISPPTLSRNIKQLEEQLGTRLFIRDNRSVSLTAEGKLFRQYAREALGQWDALKNTLLASGQELQGEISIFCSVTASYSFLYDILSEFRLKYPKIEIKLHTGDTAQAITRVLSGREDMAIAARPEQLPTSLAFKRIAVSPLVFIAPKGEFGQLQEAHEDIDKARWNDTPMILSEEGLSRQRAEQWFREQGISPRIYAQVAGHEAIVSMVSLGFGVGVVPRIVLDNSPLADNIDVLKVQPQLEDYQVGLCTLHRKLESAVKNPLINALWQQIRPHL